MALEEGDKDVHHPHRGTMEVGQKGKERVKQSRELPVSTVCNPISQGSVRVVHENTAAVDTSHLPPIHHRIARVSPPRARVSKFGHWGPEEGGVLEYPLPVWGVAASRNGFLADGVDGVAARVDDDRAKGGTRQMVVHSYSYAIAMGWEHAGFEERNHRGRVRAKPHVSIEAAIRIT